MTWLCSDWDNRDPQDDIHDIDTGRYLTALQQLPQNIRSLIQDADLRIEVADVDGNYRITKIVKKREPEYLQGSDTHFVLDEDGRKINVSEEEMDELLGITHNPEDIYNSPEVELETIHHDHTCPRDVWDVIFDATEFVREASRAVTLHNEGSYKIQPGVLEEMAEEYIYSADWFPYPADRKLHSAKGREIARQIENGISRSDLARLLRRPVRDQRIQQAKKLRREAKKLPLGEQRAALMSRAIRMEQQAWKASRNYEGQRDLVGNADRRKLWDLWREKEMAVSGAVKLTSWQFEKAYRAKLNKQVTAGQISSTEASQKLSERMKALYDVGASYRKQRSHKQPQWLEEAQKEAVTSTEDNSDYQEQNWLPEANFTSEEHVCEDTLVSDGNEHVLLTEG